MKDLLRTVPLCVFLLSFETVRVICVGRGRVFNGFLDAVCFSLSFETVRVNLCN